MIKVRKAAERGHFDHGWLNTYHTFSFGDYRDAAHMGFGHLRVINEDRVQPGQGFPTHSHRDMEIVSYVLEGALEHRDSMGNNSIIRPGEVQRMSAGTGITHSEYNHSPSDLVHFLQIWIVPEAGGLKPGYEQKLFPEAEKRGRLRLIVSRDGRDGSVTVHQDVSGYATLLASGEKVEHSFPPDRQCWIQVARGAVRLNDERLAGGDGAAVTAERLVAIVAEQPAEVLLFDLPA